MSAIFMKQQFCRLSTNWFNQYIMIFRESLKLPENLHLITVHVMLTRMSNLEPRRTEKFYGISETMLNYFD